MDITIKGRLNLATSASALLCAAVFFAQTLRLPNALGGPNLAVLLGLRGDSHLLTSGAWHFLAAHTAYSAKLLYGCNLIALAVVVGAVVLVAAQLRGSLWAAFLAGAVVAASPFARSIALDPLGAEALVGVAILVLLAAVLAGAYDVPRFVKAALPVLLVLQSPEFCAPALVCSAALARRDRTIGGLALALTTALAATRFLMPAVPHVLHVAPVSVDSPSVALTIVGIGFACFVLSPVLLLVFRDACGAQKARFSQSVFLLFVGLCALTAGLFLAADPSAAMFAAEICIVLALLAAAENAILTAAVLSLGLAGTLIAFVPLHRVLPSITIARQSALLRGAVAAAPAGVVCVAQGSDSANGLLADGGFARLYAKEARLQIRDDLQACVQDTTATPTEVAVVGSSHISVWDGTSIALARAVAAGAGMRAVSLPVATGRMEPKHGRLGAFATTVSTPQGAVEALTVTAGYTYRFACVALDGRSRLSFAVFDPLVHLRHADPVRFTVLADGKQRLAQTIVPASKASSKWTYYDIPVGAGKGCVSLTFAATAPTGSAIGSWVTIAAPTLRGE